MWKILPLSILPVLLASCGIPAEKKDDWDKMRVIATPPGKGKLVFGKGLEGRMENGEKVYTVVVAVFVTKDGKVGHAEVSRSDAPMRLQWAAVKAVRRFRFKPSPTPRIGHQMFVFKGLKVEPD
jgi:TonB family protein